MLHSDVNDLVDELVAFVRTWYRGHLAVARACVIVLLQRPSLRYDSIQTAVVEITKRVVPELSFSTKWRIDLNV